VFLRDGKKRREDEDECNGSIEGKIVEVLGKEGGFPYVCAKV